MLIYIGKRKFTITKRVIFFRITFSIQEIMTFYVMQQLLQKQPSESNTYTIH